VNNLIGKRKTKKKITKTNRQRRHILRRRVVFGRIGVWEKFLVEAEI
jgi:hypothetical protein